MAEEAKVNPDFISEALGDFRKSTEKEIKRSPLEASVNVLKNKIESLKKLLPDQGKIPANERLLGSAIALACDAFLVPMTVAWGITVVNSPSIPVGIGFGILTGVHALGAGASLKETYNVVMGHKHMPFD